MLLNALKRRTLVKWKLKGRLYAVAVAVLLPLCGIVMHAKKPKRKEEK
jgi:hypothetical protein